MKIQITTYKGFEDKDVKDYIFHCLNGDDYNSGAVEAARKTADNVCEAFGKLIDLLSAKGLLTATDIKDIAGDFMANKIELIK